MPTSRTSLEAENSEICPICGVNRIQFGETMCESCRRKSEYEDDEDVDPDKDEEWKTYLDDDMEDLTLDDEELEEEFEDEEESEEDLYYSRFEDVVSSVGYLLRKGPDNARALFVEPGTRLGGLTLMRLRGMILEQGLEVHGPCPHQGPCPLLQEMDFASETSRIAGKTWCHATFAPQGAPDWLEGLTAETGFARESLSLSWLEVGREQEAPEHAGQAEQGGEKTGQGRSRSAIEARVISNAFSVPDLGRCRYACSQLGLLLLAGAEDIPDGASLTLDVNDIGAARKDRRSGARILRLVSGSRALADRERTDRRKSDRMPARNERRR